MDYLKADAEAIEVLWHGLAEKSDAVLSALSQLNPPRKIRHSFEPSPAFYILPFLRLFEISPGNNLTSRTAQYKPNVYLGMRNGQDSREIYDAIRRNAFIRKEASDLILAWHAYERLAILKAQGESPPDYLILKRQRQILD